MDNLNLSKHDILAELCWVEAYGFKPDPEILGYDRVDKALRMAIEIVKESDIIHCKDCKYCDILPNMCTPDMEICTRTRNWFAVNPSDKGFCKWAERKDDGEN